MDRFQLNCSSKFRWSGKGLAKTGVFAIETKNWSGKLDVRNNRLFVGDNDRSWAIDDLYRESIAVQIALGSILNR